MGLDHAYLSDRRYASPIRLLVLCMYLWIGVIHLLSIVLEQGCGRHYLGRAVDNAPPAPRPECEHLLELLNQINRLNECSRVDPYMKKDSRFMAVRLCEVSVAR